MTGIDYLQTLHTKQILNLKNEYQGRLMFHGVVRFTWNGTLVEFTYKELKQILSERPHIPRRLETRRIRQIAAKSRVRAQSTRRESLNY
jgi:hypothetical protein